MKAWLLRLLASPLGRWLTGTLLIHFPGWLPLRGKQVGANWVSFPHPQPDAPYHLVLLPRRRNASLAELDAQDTALLSELISTVQQRVRQDGLERGGYRLVVNAGRYQTFPHLHFHLLAEPAEERHD